MPWPRQLRPKLRMTFLRLCFRSSAWVCRAVRRRLHGLVMREMSSNVFLSFIEGGGIGDALRALFTRKRIDDEMRRADEPLLHGGGSLDGDELVHERLVNASAKLA